MNVADLKLGECYWQQIKSLVQGQDVYKRLFHKLHLLELMNHQIQVFLPSPSMQEAVSSIIREILFFPDIHQQTESNRDMLAVSMQIFMLSSQAQAISHCVFTFLDVFKRGGDDEKFLLTLMNRYGVKVHLKLLQFVNNKSAQTVSDPVCRILDYLFAKSPALVFEVDNNAY